MLQQIEEKIRQLSQDLEKSAANHNSMLGAMKVLNELYNDAIKAEKIIEIIDPPPIPEADNI